jgi:hypothetical protein
MAPGGPPEGSFDLSPESKAKIAYENHRAMRQRGPVVHPDLAAAASRTDAGSLLWPRRTEETSAFASPVSRVTGLQKFAARVRFEHEAQRAATSLLPVAAEHTRVRPVPLRSGWWELLTYLWRRPRDEARQSERTDAKQVDVRAGPTDLACTQLPVPEPAATPALDPLVEEARALIVTALQIYSTADLFHLLETADVPAVQHLILDLYLQALQTRDGHER